MNIKEEESIAAVAVKDISMIKMKSVSGAEEAASIIVKNIL